MNKLLEFLTKRDWLGHIAEAVVMAGIVFFIAYASSGFSWHLTSLLVGGAWAAGHFHGREKRDCEVRTRMQPPHLHAYKFWLWNKDELTDFFPVLALFVLLFMYVKWS